MLAINKYIREKRGVKFTQEEIAMKLNIPVKSYQEYELKGSVHPKVLRKLSKALDFPLTEAIDIMMEGVIPKENYYVNENGADGGIIIFKPNDNIAKGRQDVTRGADYREKYYEQLEKNNETFTRCLSEMEVLTSTLSKTVEHLLEQKR